MTKYLFVYGTLMNRSLAVDLVGHGVTTYTETLNNFKRIGLNIVESEGDKVDGVAFEVTSEDLEKLDHYEGVEHNLYKRIKIKLDSGLDAIAYQKVNRNAVVFAGSTVG